MDDDGLNMRNWGYSEPPFRGHLGLQLMPTMADRSPRTFFSGRENGVMVSADVAYDQRNSGAPDTQVFSIDCLRNSWENQREKFLNILPVNHSYALLPEPYQTHHFKMPQPSDAPRDDRMFHVEGASIKQEIETVNEGVEICIPKNPKPKKPRKNRGAPKGNGTGSGHCMKAAKKNIDIVINGINMDISVIPIPVCSCTGAPHQCYRWGCGGWQSACCTTGISIHPLPMSTKRRGARIAGRKMSQGAFKKVLEKLAAEGYNFSKPIDMKTYWAKHGTNKFVTIR